MCLLGMIQNEVPNIALVLLSNRDEYLSRPTILPSTFWEADGSSSSTNSKKIFGGRDGVFGGTWFGLSVDGRFAALLNIRVPSAELKMVRWHGVGYVSEHIFIFSRYISSLTPPPPLPLPPATPNTRSPAVGFYDLVGLSPRVPLGPHCGEGLPIQSL